MAAMMGSRYGPNASTALLAAGIAAADLADPLYEFRMYGDGPWLFCTYCKKWYGEGHTQKSTHQNGLSSRALADAIAGLF